jgi:hypothetical protein
MHTGLLACKLAVAAYGNILKMLRSYKVHEDVMRTSRKSSYVLQHNLIIAKVEYLSSSYCRLEEVFIRLKLCREYVGLRLLVLGPHPQTVWICRGILRAESLQVFFVFISNSLSNRGQVDM